MPPKCNIISGKKTSAFEMNLKPLNLNSKNSCKSPCPNTRHEHINNISVNGIGSQLAPHRSDSITPSDSVSQRPSVSMQESISHQPATRPSHYPPEILWHFEDCKNDPDVGLSDANQSRPSMEKATRHEDGTMITAAEWSAIKALARLIKFDLLNLPPPRDPSAKKKSKTKLYFRTYHHNH